MSELTGKILSNRYRVDSFLGRGGMAQVYKVWDNRRMTFLAMKVLHEDLSLDRIFMRRFQREAQTLEKLQHPNIVRFYGLEQDGRLAFMLLDFIEGETLKHKIFDAAGPMPEDEIRNVMRSICGALQFAHSDGMVHCDIKPGNIMIDEHDKVLLSDFGIARMSDAATATMVGMGTPAYMAPEQARGLDPSPQTDIYALGIVLFEMLTGGERPFTGEQSRTTGSTSEKVRWEQINLPPPSPKRWNPDISDELEAVVLKCLAKKPDERYESAIDIINALELAISEGYEVPLVEHSAKEIEADDPVSHLACPQCDEVIQTDWHLCPKCGITLKEDIQTKDPVDEDSHPLPDSTSPKRIPKGCVVFGSIFALMVIGFISAYFYFGFHRTQQAAKMAPADTISMITFSPGPIQLIQLANAQNLVNAAPVFGAVPGMPEWVMTLIEDFEVNIDLDPIEDILPWIGRESSLVFVPAHHKMNAPKGDYDSWPFIITVGSRNSEAASEFIGNIVGQLEAQNYDFSESSYLGYSINEITSDGVIPLAITNLENSILITSDMTLMHATLDRYLGKQKDILFEQKGYQQFLNKLAGNRLGFVFLNWPVIVENYRLETTDFPYADQIVLGESAGMAIKLNAEGMNLDFLIKFDIDTISPLAFNELGNSFSSDKLQGYSPENTLLLLGGKNLSDMLDLITQSSFWNERIDIGEIANYELNWDDAEIKTADDFVEVLNDYTGFHLYQDILDYNAEEFGLMVVSDIDGLYGNEDIPFGLLFSARMDDPKVSFENFQQFIEMVFENEDVDHHREQIDDINVWYVEHDFGVLMGYTYWGDVLLIGSSKNVMRDVLGDSSQHLSDSAFYRSATRGLSSNKNKLVYFNLEDTLLYSREIIGDVPLDVKKYIDPIKAISIATEPIRRDGWLGGNIAIYSP